MAGEYDALAEGLHDDLKACGLLPEESTYTPEVERRPANVREQDGARRPDHVPVPNR